jgi:serine protease Do
LNTFIFTESGGSQGLGFAIPSAVIAAAYPQLREFGHLHRGVVGINVQAITPALAAGLQLPRTAGVIVSDVMPGSPAESAGVAPRDVVATVNGKPIDSVPVLTLTLATAHAGDVVTLGIVRDSGVVSIPISVIERPHEADDLRRLADPTHNAVPRLGILAVDLDDTTRALVPGRRFDTGVLVTARRQGDIDSPLMGGDIIHALDTHAVSSVDGLQVLVDSLKPNSDLVLQIERDQRLMFVTMTVY